jgi:uncharacterized protein (TIGR02996 family)
MPAPTQGDFVRKILGFGVPGQGWFPGDLAACGPFADWLQEHGREREASLLRKRWARWDKERRVAEEEKRTLEKAAIEPFRKLQELIEGMRNASFHYSFSHLTDHKGGERADDSLRRYVRERFGDPSQE